MQTQKQTQTWETSKGLLIIAEVGTWAGKQNGQSYPKQLWSLAPTRRESWNAVNRRSGTEKWGNTAHTHRGVMAK